MKRPALFLDRDGVINVDHGYVYRKEDFKFLDGIFDVVAQACRSGYFVVIVTNQAGIGRGYYTEQAFNELMFWVRGEFEKRAGRIDAVYFCPYHPEHGVGEYRRDSECRKPSPGMLLKAARDHSIDLDRSIMIGDKESDMQAARAAGVGIPLHLDSHSSTGDWLSITSLRETLSYL